MGAHTAPGHQLGRTATATAGVAAALVTTATTGVLTGGTALASDGHGGSGHHHGESHGSHRDAVGSDPDEVGGSADALAEQTLCDVLGDVDLSGSGSCSSDDDEHSSEYTGDAARSGHDGGSTGLFDQAASARGRDGTTSEAADTSSSSSSQPQQDQPAPRPTQPPPAASSVPDRTTVQPITPQPSGSGPAPAQQGVVPIGR